MAEERPAGSFATTQWTVVLSASRSDPAQARAALENLCRTYWYPLYAYVRRRGHSAADAEDLTQGFFARLLELHSLEQGRKEKGRFRSFLLASLNHYLSDEWDRASAAKRDVRRTVALNIEQAETRYGREAADTETAERVFERQWALTLLEVVVRRLQKEYDSAGKGALFLALRFAISGEGKPAGYERSEEDTS